MKTPIAFIIFNRPKQAKLVFEAIRAARPETLLVIADGPRSEDERAVCQVTRDIISEVDWKCEVRKNYSEKNLGCRKRVSSGLDWVFQEVDRAIILEDDCLPDPSFFQFCEKLLERYKDDGQIMSIGGNFFQQKNKSFNCSDSYYFSILPHIWGWATWRRAWLKYDVDLARWPEIKKQKTLESYFNNPGAYEYWSHVWDQYYNKRIDSWDGQWFFACAVNKGVCINPNVNLVSNIGFGEKATHTRSSSEFSKIPVGTMQFPLCHPEKIAVNRVSDKFTFQQIFGIDKKMRYRFLRPFKTRFPEFYQSLRRLFGKQ
jgi:hypothetical protein